MHTDQEQIRQAIRERSTSVRAHAIGTALVLISVFSILFFKIQPINLPLAIILPCTSLIGAFLFVFETFRTGVALRVSIAGATKVYRSDGAGDFYATAITSSLAHIFLAAAPVVASFIAWQRLAA